MIKDIERLLKEYEIIEEINFQIPDGDKELNIKSLSQHLAKLQTIGAISFNKNIRFKISTKRAMIIIFEERLQDENDKRKREDYFTANIYKNANVRFHLSNREKPRPLTELHPEKPCHFFEDKGSAKGKYKVNIDYIIGCPNDIFEIKTTKQSLKEIYNEVSLC